MGSDRSDGPDFYDAADRVDRYLQHHHDPERSPNLTIEQPAVLARVGDMLDLDVVDLGCGDAPFGTLAIDTGVARTEELTDPASCSIVLAAGSLTPTRRWSRRRWKPLSFPR